MKLIQTKIFVLGNGEKREEDASSLSKLVIMKKKIQTVLVKIQQDAGLEFLSQRNQGVMSNLVIGQTIYNLLNLRTKQRTVNKTIHKIIFQLYF